LPSLRYLSLTPRRVALAAILSGVAAVGGAAYAYHQPSTYTATSTVFVARVIPDAAGSNVSTVVATFQTALQLPQTVAKVAKESGVPTDSLDSGLKDAEVASSSAVTVSFTDTAPSIASTVVTTATKDALLSLGSQQAYGAQDQVSAAQRALSTAESTIAAFNRVHGTDDFGTQFQEAEQDALNLEDALAAASPQQVPAIETAIHSVQSELNRMSAADPQWQLLDVALTQAQAALQTAEQDYTTAEGNLIAATSPTVLTPPQVTQNSRMSPTVRLGLMSAVVMIALSLGCFAVFGILDRGVERRRLEEEEEEAKRREKEWTGPWRRSSDQQLLDARSSEDPAAVQPDDVGPAPSAAPVRTARQSSRPAVTPVARERRASGRAPTPSPDSDATAKSGPARPQGQG
jgi:hypothetical protein